jgi:hypothetical protein
MLADEFPDMGFRGPQHYGGSSVVIHCYVADVDALAEQAAAAVPQLPTKSPINSTVIAPYH